MSDRTFGLIGLSFAALVLLALLYDSQRHGERCAARYALTTTASDSLALVRAGCALPPQRENRP